MREIDPTIICCAKYLPPMALVFHIFLYFFQSKYEYTESAVYTMLFVGWLAAREVCKAYTDLYKKTHKNDE